MLHRLLVALLALEPVLGRRGRGVARGRGRAPAARVWNQGVAWDHKAKEVGSRDPSATRRPGRSRASKRTAVYDRLRGYDEHWQKLILAEWEAEQTTLVQQIEKWPQQRLTCEGWLLTNLEAMQIDDYFGETVVKCSLRARAGSRNTERLSRVPLPFHRFAPGDVVSLCKGERPLLPAWMRQSDEPTRGQELGEAIDGVILQRTTTALHVIVRQLPVDLEGVPTGRRAAAAASPFCLSRGASAVPYERCSNAIASISTPDLPHEVMCTELRTVITGSLATKGSSTPESEALLASAGMPPAFLGKRGATTATVKAAVQDILRRSGQQLNPSQLATIRSALRRRVSLIQGPAGTGKTKTACCLVAAAVRLHQTVSSDANTPAPRPVLAVAASNVAADELLEGLRAIGVRAIRVGQTVSVRESLRNATLDAALERCEPVLAARAKLRACQNGGSKSGSAVSAAFQEVRRAEAAASLRLLKTSEVVISSCIGTGKIADLIAGDSGESPSRSRKGRPAAPPGSLSFGSVLIDEATQATEPASLVPLLLGAQQVFLVGDSRQLPPTVTDADASRKGLSISLFERLQRIGLTPSLLDTQYRMHPSLAEFSSKRFYNGKLRSGVTDSDRKPPQGLRWPNPEHPIAHVRTTGSEEKTAAELGVSEGTSYSNQEEVDTIAELVRAALSSGDLEESDIGIITPYSAQALLLRRALDASMGSDSDAVEVASVDGFQGREKELIFFSSVRSNSERRIGFVADDRRLNVAITRAKRGLVIVGNDATLSSHDTWRDLFSSLKRKKCIVDTLGELLPE